MPWDPWWLKHSAKSVSLTRDGANLVQPLVQQELVESSENDMESNQLHDVPHVLGLIDDAISLLYLECDALICVLSNMQRLILITLTET
ncbi:Hypothetical predicted protein [Olea europaea subsp. europaea]|uniref:Uncharacterized protein n=1 Tax=Olea europaea subsp. europaea TaxID=158383 RepID=A0A8S0V540_OLEEU|nr:Hypothetical predicted protein [Olea europaea subsp. europaea]